jgi:hypothetical protein
MSWAEEPPCSASGFHSSIAVAKSPRCRLSVIRCGSLNSDWLSTFACYIAKLRKIWPTIKKILFSDVSDIDWKQNPAVSAAGSRYLMKHTIYEECETERFTTYSIDGTIFHMLDFTDATEDILCP